MLKFNWSHSSLFKYSWSILPTKFPALIFRPGHFAEALERCELEHEIKPKDFPLASSDYEGEVSKLVTLMRAHNPKRPLVFARSSEARKVESCLAWLGSRVEQEFKLRVFELESFIEELVKFTNNTPPTFAQIRRLLFETKFDFVQGNRCDFHCQTNKIACAIGNVRKYFYFLSEIMYDYYQYDIAEGHHYPKGFDNSCAASRAASTYSVMSSVAGDRYQDFEDTTSVASSFSVGSYQHKRNVDPPRRPTYDTGYSAKPKMGAETPELLSQVSNFSIGSNTNSFGSANSFVTANTHFSSNHSENSFSANSFSAANSPGNSGASASHSHSNPRRPNVPSKEDFTYDKPYNQPIPKYNNYSSPVNSFTSSPSTVRSMSPAFSTQSVSSPPQYQQPLSPYNPPSSYNPSSSFNQSNNPPSSSPQTSLFSQPGGMAGSVAPSVGRSRARGYKHETQERPVVSMGRGRGRGTGSLPGSATGIPRRPNTAYEYGVKSKNSK